MEPGGADEEDEHQFIDDTDSDLDIASSGGAYSPTNGFPTLLYRKKTFNSIKVQHREV
jgi:hypothetical protein